MCPIYWILLFLFILFLKFPHNEGKKATKPNITGATYMLGTLTVEYTFDGLDVLGNSEIITGALIYQGGEEIADVIDFFYDEETGSGTVQVFDFDLEVGLNDLEMAFIDDEGTEGLRSLFSVEVADKGPTAPIIDSVSFLPNS